MHRKCTYLYFSGEGNKHLLCLLCIRHSGTVLDSMLCSNSYLNIISSSYSQIFNTNKSIPTSTIDSVTLGILLTCMHRTENKNLLSKILLLLTLLGNYYGTKFPLWNLPGNRFTSFNTNYFL